MMLLLLFHEMKKIEYNGSDSIKGLVFGGMAGHKYIVIDDLVSKGQIKRINGDHERGNLRILLEGRIDFTLLPNSTIKYLTKEMNIGNKIYLAKKPYQEFTRQFLMPKDRKDLKHFISKLEINENKDWKNITKKYGL